MDAQLLETLYRKYYSAAYAYCLTLCSSEQTAQDIVSYAFVKAWLSLPEDIPSFRYWLLRVCKNLWIDQLRRQSRQASGEPLAYLPDPATPELLYLTNERNRVLWAAIRTLSPLDQELVTLHYFSGLSVQEAARMVGKSYGAVRQRMVRLRKELKQRMEEQGYGQQL